MERSMITEKDLAYFVNHTIDQWMFQEPPTTVIFGIILPIVAGIGILFNFLAFIVFNHREMRGFTTVLLRGNLIIDSAFLFTLVLVLTPRQWMYTAYESGDQDYFWETLSDIQMVFIRTFPCNQIGSLCSQWITMVIIVEHYYAFYEPIKVVPCMQDGRGLKVLVALFDLTVLIHVTTFFKFIQEDIYIFDHEHVNQTEHITHHATLISLAEIYTFQSFTVWDQYIYFLFCELAPWVITFVCWAFTVLAYVEAKGMIEGTAVAHKRIILPLKGGRCLRSILIIVFMFLVLKFISHVMYMCSMPYMKYSNMFQSTFLTPVDIREVDAPDTFLYTYITVNVLNSLVKPFVLIIGSLDMQLLVRLSCLQQVQATKKTGRNVTLAMKPRRRRTLSSGEYDVEAGSRATDSTLDLSLANSTTQLTGSAAPY